MNDNEVLKELESIAPGLIKSKGNGGYEVPNGYFEDIETRMLAQIPDEANTVRRIHPWFWRVAAVGLLLIAAFFLMRNDKTNISPSQATAATDADLYLEYIKTYPEEFEMDILVESGLLDDVALQSEDFEALYLDEDTVEIQ